MKIIRNSSAALMLSFLTLSGFLTAAHSEEVWKYLSAPAPTPPAAATGYVNTNGAKIYFAIHGSGEPLILLHGGLGNTDYWGSQIAAFSAKYRVIAIASRGHGRSTNDGQPYGYHLMATDIVAVMDALAIPKASLVGWSDGGNIGLDMAITNPDRLVKLVTFGANFNPAGVMPSVETNATFGAYVEKTSVDYKELSSTPAGFNSFVEQITKMWANQPNFTESQLGSIPIPVAIVAGEHDEAIDPLHTKELAGLIPSAKLIIMPGLSHFGMWQNPEAFNSEIMSFFKAD